MPTDDTYMSLLAFARDRGQLKPHTKGAVAPYLWCVMEIAYLCRLRGIEVVTFVEGQTTPDGLLTERCKESRNNVVRWSPRLRAAWEAAIAIRNAATARTKRPVPIRSEGRPVIVCEDGTELKKSSFDTAWQRLVRVAIADGVLTKETRFALHGLKHKGVTDTKGTRADKREASGHRSDSMLDVYDHSVPIVEPAGQP